MTPKRYVKAQQGKHAYAQKQFAAAIARIYFIVPKTIPIDEHSKYLMLAAAS